MIGRDSSQSSSNLLNVWLLHLIPWLLLILTAAVLVLNIPDGELLSVYSIQVLLFAFLTAFALFFGVWLSRGELSPAHAIGIVAFLSLPAETLPLILWTICGGGVIGVMTMLMRSRAADHGTEYSLHSLIFITARVTLSYFAAAQVYIALDGPLPLASTDWADFAPTFFALSIYCLVYVTVYFAIFVMELYVRALPVGQVLRTNIALLVVILFLPIPFSILGAEVSNLLSAASEVISLLGIMLIILGLHALSQSEYQLRKQLNELQTLSIVTRAMRSHLELDGLLKTVYLQVAHLLEIENFIVVLHSPTRPRFEMPLVIRDGREITGAPEVLARQYTDALIEHVMKTGTSLLISHDVAGTAREMRLEPPVQHSESWLGVPLLAGGRDLGAIIVTAARPDQHFDRDDLRLLNIVAASASIAIENAQLYHQQTRRAEQLSTLNSVASLLSGTLSPDTVLDIVISSASMVAGANAVAIYISWEDSGVELPLLRAGGMSDEFIDNPPGPLLPIDDKPLYAKMPLVIEDIQADPRAADFRVLMAREEKASLVELPLATGENDLGVLVLYFNQQQAFESEQLELLRTFATQAAQAINNARTYATTDEAFQRSVEQLLSLAGIGRVLTSTVDLKTICELILTHTLEATGSSIGAVALHDDNGGNLRVLAQSGYPEAVLQGDMILNAGVNRRALETGESQRVDDTRQTGDYSYLVKTTRSQLTVPIMRGKEYLGFIALESDRLGAFSDEDSHFVAQLANQAVIAIDNARLFTRITEARDRMQVILDAMDEALILVNARGKIALANPRIDLIGLEPDALVNQQITDLLKADAVPNFAKKLGFNTEQELESLLHMLSTSWDDEEEPEPHLFVASDDAGMRYIQRFIIPIRDEGGQIMGALLVFYDKTEEQELNRAREELSRMIVHDLRSPLTAVTTSLKLLREVVPKESDFYNVVATTTEASRRAVKKLLGRVDSLLDISKMQSGRLTIDPDLTDLPTLADSVCVELSPLAHELNINVTSQIDGDVPLLNIDADKVERLLLNLVDNALKYSPSQSTVIIRAYPPDDDFVRVEVVDNGPGIPAEYKESLFDSFVQVKGRAAVRRGVGLGLAFCKLVADAHGGRIWFEDNPEGGSIFAFTLPVAQMAYLPDDLPSTQDEDRFSLD